MHQRIRTLPWLAALTALLATLAASAAFTAAKAHALDPVTGRRRALVVVVQWGDDYENIPASTPQLTAAQVGDVITNDTNPWYASVSRGMFLGWDVDVAGTYTIDPRDSSFPNARCEVFDPDVQITVEVIRAARNDGFDYEDYDNVVIYNERPSGCNWASRADVGGKFSLLRGASVIRRHAIHELGHNLGLNHSGRITCRDGSGRQVTLSNDCTTTFGPGDEYNIMSGDASATFSFAASQQWALGWMGQRTLDLTVGSQPAHLYLQPLESPSLTIQAVRVQDLDATYWVEYRADLGVDATVGERIERTGVVIRRDSPNDPTKPILLDTDITPTSQFSFLHADLLPGQSWTNPLGNLRFTVNSIGPLGAEITIKNYSDEFPYTPNVLGLDRAAATRAITAAGFTLGTVTFRVDQTCGYIDTVMDQTPGGGFQRAPGSPVAITIGTRPTGGCG